MILMCNEDLKKIEKIIHSLFLYYLLKREKSSAISHKKRTIRVIFRQTRQKGKKMGRRAAFHTLGCKVNAYETEAMEELLQQAGYDIVGFNEKADVYVVNTCSVTNIAERKSRQMLHRAKKMNPEAVVVAAGCYVQVSEEEARADEAVDLILGNNQKHQIVSVLDAYFDGRELEEVLSEVSKEQYEELEVSTVLEHTRAFVKVQDGCNQFCSYCIIPYARGRVRSRRVENVIEEVKRLAASGIHEIVLTGIHLSSYGREIDKESHLIELIEAIHPIEGIDRIRLGSLEPRIITEEFIARLKNMYKVCPHFHLSLQSGCEETLKRMNRHYTPEEYYEKCVLLRENFENPAITTDVIVGFPGETEEEFEKTYSFLDKVHFYEMHIFRYSRRKGTRADKMDNQVPDEKKAERSAVLSKLEASMTCDFRKQWTGKEVSILLEERQMINGVSYMVGHTPEYIKCAVKTDAADNTLIKAVIDKELTADVMQAHILE